MIPRKIISIWLSLDGTMPELIQKCIESQKATGYSHKIITLDNCFRGSRYVNEALAKAEETKDPRWLVKSADFLRAWHVHDEGSVFLDADTEVLPGKNFDDLLENDMFVVFEKPWRDVCNGIWGARAGAPLLKEYFDRVENNYRGDGDLVLRPGLQTFNDIIWAAHHENRLEELRLKLCQPNEFFPYNYETGEIKITPETRTYHHYARTWCVGDSAGARI